MRLGGPVFYKGDDPQAWARSVSAGGYRAAYCPLEPKADDATVRAYARAAQAADIVIAEVGAWCNPLSSDETKRKNGVLWCQKNLALAERIGARCCVNIAGSRGEKWDGPCPLDLTDETFDLIVATVRMIIDAVRPAQSCYTLETMPRMYPDSADNYLRLIRAIDRKAFAVHFDPVNLINCPRLYFQNGALIQEFVRLLGPHIRSCHAKDITLGTQLTVHLDEVRPGLGRLDYRTFLRSIQALPGDIPVMLEHLPNEAEYNLAASHIRSIARELQIEL